MSSFYDDASLVLIPSGYKASKIYSQKPTSGAGDFVATRASNATRVGSNGLIEEVRTNLVLQSEAFNTTWAAGRGSVTANATTAPNGTTTADKFVADTQPSSHFVSQTISGLTSGGIYTSSVYAKAAEWNSVAIFRGDSAIGVSFRLDTQATTILNGTPTTFSITSVGNGWFRCSVSFAIASTSDSAQVRVGNDGAYSIVGNNVNGVFLWGAQYELSDFGATNYIPTTTTSVSVGPTNNVPRLDYLNSTCPRLLLEPQRTNVVTFSEQFNNAAWTKSGNGVGSVPVITANAAISPDGYQNADKIDLALNGGTGASDWSWVYQNFTATASQPQAASIYLKAATAGDVGKKIRVGFIGYVEHTLTADWTRVELVQTSGSTSSYSIGFRLRGIEATANSVSFFAYGAQLEQNAPYVSSYIPTLSTSVTRVADAASKTGVAGLIGDSAGFIFGEVSGLTNSYGSQSTIFSVSDAATNVNSIILSFNATTGYLTPRIYKANSTIFVTDYLLGTLTNSFKFVISYGAGRAVCYINGVKAQDVSGLTFFSDGTLTRMGMDSGNGGSPCFGNIKQILIGTSALTDAQCIELTTI
jgi:hypothetical protein